MQKQKLTNISDRMRTLRDTMFTLKGRIENIEGSLIEHKKQRHTLLNEELLHDQCVKVFQTLVELKKEEIKVKIESLVTKGLRTIFNRPDFRFELIMEIKRGVMSAKPVLHSNFNDDAFASDIIDSHGGGIVDVTAFLLQVVTLLAFKKITRLMVCDEPFRNVSRDYLENVAEFLTYLCDISGMQIIMVTHKPEFKEHANKVFQVELNAKKESVITEL